MQCMTKYYKSFCLDSVTWCAKLYQHDYSGWEFLVTETQGISDIPSCKDNAVSSVKVRNGCQFVAYQDFNGQNLLFNITEDMPNEDFGDKNDKISSYSCHCGECTSFANW